MADIGKVKEMDADDLGRSYYQNFEGEVVSVIEYDHYWKCNTCYSGMVMKHTDGIGKCTKCRASVKLGKCISKSMMKVLLESVDGTKIAVTISGDERLMKVAQVNSMENIEEDMLNSIEGVFEISGKEVIDIKWK